MGRGRSRTTVRRARACPNRDGPATASPEAQQAGRVRGREHGDGGWIFTPRRGQIRNHLCDEDRLAATATVVRGCLVSGVGFGQQQLARRDSSGLDWAPRVGVRDGSREP